MSEYANSSYAQLAKQQVGCYSGNYIAIGESTRASTCRRIITPNIGSSSCQTQLTIIPNEKRAESVQLSNQRDPILTTGSKSIVQRDLLTSISMNPTTSTSSGDRHPSHFIPPPPIITQDAASQGKPVAAKASKDDHYRKLSKPYGLHIHRSRHIDKDERMIEVNDELIKDTIFSLKMLIYELRGSIEFKDENSKVLQVMEAYLSICNQLLNNLVSIQNHLDYIYGISRAATTTTTTGSDQENPIRAFHFEFRGLFLTIRYTIDKHLEKMRRVWRMAQYPRRELKWQRRVRKLDVLLKLSQMAVVIVSEREAVMQRCQTGPATNLVATKYYPFCDSLNMNEYKHLTEMNVSDYFGRIGGQFAPMLRVFLGLMVAVTASHSNSLEYDPKFRTGIFFASNMYYMLNAKEAANRTSHFFSKNLSVKTGKDLWTMQDSNKLVKTATFIGLPDIELSVTFSIPFQKPRGPVALSHDVMKAEIRVAEKNEQKEEELLGGIKKQEITGSSTMQELSFYLDQVPKLLSTVTNLSDTVGIRLIADKKLETPKSPPNIDMKSESPKSPDSPLSPFVRDFPHLSRVMRKLRMPVRISSQLRSKYNMENRSNRDALIFHVHGGGFIAMSSFSHEVYLRPWATQTGLPIVSIDYTKTPDQQYPVQLEECYQAYRWILNNAEQSLGVSLNKIVFAGDSAGGNLVLAVLIRAISDGIRLPDALVLSYPATHLHFAPSPARIISLLDPLLNFKLLELCGMEYYLNPANIHVKNNAQRNPLISPSMTPDEVLKQFPKTYINCGSLDPLFDDAIYFAKRLEEAIGCQKVKLEVYDSLGHGYLNLIDFVPEAKLANTRICDWIKQELSNQ